MTIKGIIFDLDGVLTDTAEYHYQAWQRLAEEEGFTFNRSINENLRGVSRQRSLEIILNGRPVEPEAFDRLLACKNQYYVESLTKITPNDLLPGALDILNNLKAQGIKIALGSASKNAHMVLNRLNILPYFDAVADGYSVEEGKPAPYLFDHAAHLMGLFPAECAVVEDAATGIEAALAGGFWAIGLGPTERVGIAHRRFDDTLALSHLNIAAELTAWSATLNTWLIQETEYTPQKRAHKETIFTIGNGRLSTRGTFEERYPTENRLTFVHSVFDDMPVNFTELVNVPDWTHVDLLVEGEPFSLDAPGSKIIAYRRYTNLRNGTLTRRLTWQSPQGHLIRLESERWASLANPHLLNLCYTVVPLNFSGQLEIRTGLVGHTDNQGLRHLHLPAEGERDGTLWLQTQTRTTAIEVTLAAQITITGTNLTNLYQTTWLNWGQPTRVINAQVSMGGRLSLTKQVALTTSLEGETPLERAFAQLAANPDYAANWQAHIAAWNTVWAKNDVVIENDPEAQLAARFSIFQLIIAAPRHTDRASIGAKTLSGYGYRGHVFWDTEIFITPMFTHTQPELARNQLMYRYHNLPGARQKARQNGCEGAQFPWESATEGIEVTPSWVSDSTDRTKLIRIWCGDIELHITADIAYTVWQYWQVTGDDAWMRDYGAELILEGAVFWGSRVVPEEDGFYHLRNVIGPDEYHDHVDDNTYTNRMVAWHLTTALAVLAWLADYDPTRHAHLVDRLDLSAKRLAHWRDVQQKMYFQIADNGLIEQFTGFFAQTEADLRVLRDPARTESMQALLGIETANQTQVLKQPDVLMLQYLLRDQFTPAQIQANWDYYNPRTDHEYGSSLGPSVTAILACLMNQPEEAYSHFMRAAKADLYDVRLNAGDGIHAASLGGVWQALIFGFAGFQLTATGFEFSPRFPAHWTRLAFALQVRGQTYWIELNPHGVVSITRRTV